MCSRATLSLVLSAAMSSAMSAQSVASQPDTNHYQTKSDHVTSRVQEEALTGGGLGIAPDGSLRKPAAYALGLIEDFEAWIPEPYNDASHYCTIGFGHLIAKSPCAESSDLVKKYAHPLSMESGLLLLSNDTGLASASVSKRVQVNLNDQQFGALVSFVFNVGADNFSRSALLQYVNAGDFQAAARQFGRWVKSKNRVLDGLVSRRSCEAALFAGKIPVGTETTFSRSRCSSLGAAPESDDLIDIEVGER